MTRIYWTADKEEFLFPPGFVAPPGNASAAVVALAVAPAQIGKREDAWAELQVSLEGRVSAAWSVHLKEKIKRWYLLLPADVLRWSVALAGLSSGTKNWTKSKLVGRLIEFQIVPLSIPDLARVITVWSQLSRAAGKAISVRPPTPLADLRPSRRDLLNLDDGLEVVRLVPIVLSSELPGTAAGKKKRPFQTLDVTLEEPPPNDVGGTPTPHKTGKSDGPDSSSHSASGSNTSSLPDLVAALSEYRDRLSDDVTVDLESRIAALTRTPLVLRPSQAELAARLAAQSESTPSALVGSTTGSQSGLSTTPDSTALVANCLERLVNLTEELRQAPKSKKPILSVEDQALASIEARSFFDVRRLDQKNLDHMAFFIPDDDTSSVDFGGLRVSSARVKELSYASNHDFEIWRSGYLKWVTILSNSSLAMLIADRILFLSKLEAFDCKGSLKVIFGNRFMLQNAAAPNWVDIFLSSTHDIFMFLVDKPVKYPSSLRDPKPKPPKPKNPRNIRPPPAGKPNGGPPLKKARPTEKICRSRAFVAFGQCSYPNCKFSHKCASCDRDHAAVDCGAWNDAIAGPKIAGLKP